MKVKVCGMRNPENIRELVELKPDFMGLIFYPKSSRYVADMPDVDTKKIKRVGVFVDASEEEIFSRVESFGLDYVQLHGDETVSVTKDLFMKGLHLIKVFGVEDHLPLEEMKPYEPYVDYFLLDTKTPLKGGSGRKFKWSILNDYLLNKPFFLSGGIGLEDVDEIKKMNLDKLYAIDVNSRFETSPAMKDVKMVEALMQQL